MTIVSGLHDFLCDDPEFRRAAERAWRRTGRRSPTTTSTTWPIARASAKAACASTPSPTIAVAARWWRASKSPPGLNRAGVDAAFVATGQTGILVAGSGCPIDRVISDFVSGAAEKLVLANQHHDVIVVEGQGSLFHPRYSCVTLGLLHGLMPDGLILCYEMGRRARFTAWKTSPCRRWRRVVEFYEAAANIMHPCRVIGVAVNGQRFADDAVAAECERVSRRLGLPACDVIRHGPDALVEAVQRLPR